MGNITIKIPQHIQIEYTIQNNLITKCLLDFLNTLILKNQSENKETNRLLGLFSDQADMLDEITEFAMQTRETAQLRV